MKLLLPNLLLTVLLTGQTWAQSPISPESIQLQKLVQKSEEQIKALKSILERSEQDTHSLKKASNILQKMSQGIDKSLDEYRSSEAYEQALIQLQAKDDYKKTYSDAQRVRQEVLKTSPQEKTPESQEEFNDTIEFQKDTVRANQSDLQQQGKIQKALKKAQPGYVPKLQAQTQISHWKTSTRMSSQLTELLAAIHGVREELRAMRKHQTNSGSLNSLIIGAEMQNRKHNNKRTR